MTHPSPEPPSTPPDWPHCGHGATAEDPVGCRGIHVGDHTECLAHLTDADRDAYLTGLTPGSNIDHRGTPFAELLLGALLDALRDPATGSPRLGYARCDAATFQGIARFESAVFEDDARFGSASFEGGANFESASFEGGARFGSASFQRGVRFESATFQGIARFGSASFEGGADFGSVVFEGGADFGLATFQRSVRFESATFQGDAWFRSATFQGTADFGSASFQRGVRFWSATFQGNTWFTLVTFQGDARFRSASFEGDAWFTSAVFEGGADFGLATFQRGVEFTSAAFQRDAVFARAVFERAANLGPLVCAGRVLLSGAVFGGPVTLSLAARRLECRRSRWSSTAELRLRYATVDFSHAVFEYPLTIAAEADPFVLADGDSVDEHFLAGAPDAGVRLASLRGVDAAHLVLADVDLSRCLFTGTVHLDQLRLEGACSFATVPPGTRWVRGRPVRFTPRRTLAEGHHWRARRPTAVRGWNTAVFGAGHVGPAQLAPVYRAVRKAFEDGKNEPDAADFYYGEMEMRRHDASRPHAERALLTLYWAVSGYGLRASRALAWLAAAMLLTIVLLMGFGVPKDSPRQEATGTVPPGGGRVTFEIEKDDPQNPTRDRFTDERFEKAVNVTLNSVVFRSSGQDLTTAGTYIEMTSRLVEPVLLGLAALAVRGRVKR